MPVSYRYHAYSPQRLQEGRRLKRRAKQKLTESELAAQHTSGEDSLHYGHRFAETEERAHQRKGKARTAAGAKMSRPQQGQAARGMPIGALPETEEQFEEPDRMLEASEPLDMDSLVSDAMRQLQVFTGAIRDLGEASWRLARFPLEAARAFRGRNKH